MDCYGWEAVAKNRIPDRDNDKNILMSHIKAIDFSIPLSHIGCIH